MFSNPTAFLSCRIRRLHATKSYRVNRPLDHDICKVLKSYNFFSCRKRVIKEEAAFNKVAPSKSAFRRLDTWLSCGSRVPSVRLVPRARNISLLDLSDCKIQISSNVVMFGCRPSFVEHD